MHTGVLGGRSAGKFADCCGSGEGVEVVRSITLRMLEFEGVSGGVEAEEVAVGVGG